VQLQHAEFCDQTQKKKQQQKTNEFTWNHNGKQNLQFILIPTPFLRSKNLCILKGITKKLPVAQNNSTTKRR